MSAVCMRLQRVDQLTEAPIVGRFYLVPCVRTRYSGRWWVPVQGPPHSDPDLGEAAEHYHYDARFFGPALWGWIRPDSSISDRRLRSLAIVQHIRDDNGPPVIPIVLEGPVLRRKRCTGAMPEWPLYQSLPGAAKFSRFEAQYTNKTLGGCKVCPHRGLPLGSIPPNERGEIVCPGHGLRWCAQTGKLIRQFTAGKRS